MHNVSAWVFDLDNTLYSPQARLFEQIDARMTDWLMRNLHLGRAEANHLRRDYWQRYGTTLAGLMAERGLDPVPYLAEIHDISLAELRPDPALAAAIRALPGRKFVHTNGSRRHAERVTAARGLGAVFDGIFGFEDAGFRAKPRREAFETVLALAQADPARAAMFEDDPRNLEAPRAMGMICVLVEGAPGAAPLLPAAPVAHHHYRTADLTGFLTRARHPR